MPATGGKKRQHRAEHAKAQEQQRRAQEGTKRRAEHAKAQEQQRRAQEETRRRAEEQKARERQQRKQGATSKEQEYGEILGLKGKVTKADVKKRYRELSRQYHPDKAQQLGPKIRALAEEEMKKLNEAYEYFQKKYDM
jgi:preprotein translocase subunit Sec63